MVNFFTTQLSFIILLSFFAVGAGGSLLGFKKDAFANRWSSAWAIAGSLWGIVFAVLTILTGHNTCFAIQGTTFPLLTVAFHIDLLSAFFIFTISVIALFCSVYGLGYVKHYYGKYNLGVLGFFYNMAISTLLLVVTASNGLFFLIVWELMTFSSYFLVIYEHNDKNNISAGFLYIVMTYVGTTFIVLALLLLYIHTGSFDFAVIKSGVVLVPEIVKNIVFILLLIGFGTKAGIIPFHIWLPAAHPAAPSHFSALMSGLVIKTGIYMMLRFFLDIFQPVPVWWGFLLIIIGAVSSLLGVLYALTEHDLKKLLAYHSIENIGIILLGVGSALAFYSLAMPSLALLALIAALFHTFNHAVFKSLLFLSAGAVVNEMHTRNMEEYGGLIKYMPQTALCFLIGSIAISALPPFNGFFSEWLTFQALFQGLIALDFLAKWIFIFAAGSLAFTGGLALACFVKAFGVSFLARPRNPKVRDTKEAALPMLIGMGALAMLSLLLGVFSGYVIVFLEKIAKGFAIFQDTPTAVSITSGQTIAVGNGFAAVSAPVFFIFFIGLIFLVAGLVKYLINRNQKVVLGATWDCGTQLTPRMEITATGFSRSIILIFKGILRPSIQKEIEYRDAESRYLPKSRLVSLGVQDIYQTYFYKPLNTIINGLSKVTKNIQFGNTNMYIAYIFVTLIITLLSVLKI